MNTATAARSGEIAVGDPLAPMEIDLTSTMIVAGAIASHDWMPAHHDPDYARSQGAPDIFLNILSSNAYVSRFLTDWAGPEAMVNNIKIRLGVPAIPKQTLRFSGEVLSVEDLGDERLIEVSVKAANDLGDHVTGTALLSLPLS